MSRQPIEPDAKDIMQPGYEYVKIIQSDTKPFTCTCIYYDQASTREETVWGKFNPAKFVLNGWAYVTRENSTYYYERAVDWKEQKEAKENPTAEIVIHPDDTDKMEPGVQYAQVYWHSLHPHGDIIFYDLQNPGRRSKETISGEFMRIKGVLSSRGYKLYHTADLHNGKIGYFVKENL